MAGNRLASEVDNDESALGDTVKSISKKFKCLHQGCGKMFNRKDYLARHAVNHLPVRPYQCPICPSQFARQDLLEKHMSTKSHEKRQKREAIQRMATISASAEAYPAALYDNGAASSPVVVDQVSHRYPPRPPPPQPVSPPPYQQQQQQQQQQQPPIPQPPPISQTMPLRSSTATTTGRYPQSHIPKRPQSLSSPHLQQRLLTPTTAPSSLPPPSVNGTPQNVRLRSPALIHSSELSPLLPPLPDTTMHSPAQTLRSVPIKLLYDDSTMTEHPNPPLQQHQQDRAFYASHFAGVPPPAPAAQSPSPPSQLQQQQRQSQKEPPSQQQHRPSQSQQAPQSQKQPQPAQQQLMQSQQSQAEQLQQEHQQTSRTPSATASQYMSYNSAETAVVACAPAATGATEWPPFSLDSFDLSLSDHYIWLFGTDFWTESPPETLLPSQHPTASQQQDQQLPQVSNSIYDSATSDFDGSRGHQGALSHQLPKTIVTIENAVGDAAGLSTHEESVAGPYAMQCSASVTPVAAKNSNVRNSPASDMRSPLLRSMPESSRPKKDDKDISEEVHAKMIEVLKPIPEITFDNPYFSLSAMKQYLNLYWIHFDPLYPILHRATFDPTVVEPALLIAIVTIGMAYSSDREASNLAIVIHRKFRNIVFLMIEDQPQVQLWVHQTLLLTNYFDKMLGSTVQYDMSQFFHGTNIALMHFSGYLKGLTEPPVVETNDSVFADHQWKKWIQFETTKRTAFFAFICDTQHATLFRHSPILSAFEVRLELPSTDACWIAADGVEFYHMHREQTNVAAAGMMKWRTSEAAAKADESNIVGPTIGGSTQETVWPAFLHSLKRLIRLSREDQTAFQLASFSQFSCLILLHGLLSICWDMQWRGLLDMGIVSKRRMTEFKKRLESSFANWKSYFDYQLSKSNLPSITSTVMISSHSSPTSSTAAGNHHEESNGLDTSILVRQQALQQAQGHSPLSSVLGSMNDYNNNSPMLCSNWAMFQLGLLALHVDTMSLRINAGSPNVLGRKIRTVDRENANKAVHQWARSDDGRLATWHSVQFMRRIVENESLLDQAVHIPWGVYLATLTIWSYELCQDNEHLPPHRSGQRSLSRNNRKYLTANGQHIEYMLAKHDAVHYLRMMNAQGGNRSAEDRGGAQETATATAVPPLPPYRYLPRGDPNTVQYHMKSDPNRELEIDASGTSTSTKLTTGDRQQLVIGLVAYSTALLMHIKWGFVVRGCEVLNNILKEYD
ncbi:fungal-specific transcription factor domain-containing protein [Lipomyces chichibuensis]|uniref:fungal-specific transcription factor domain-containing protein n=1 Tax=Lipomyces chichibuensis TaxID=1546026 RepID=UPI003343D7FE